MEIPLDAVAQDIISSLKRFERGAEGVDLDMLKMLAEALDIDVDLYIEPGDEE